VIKFVSDLRQLSGFLRVIRFHPPIKTDRHDIIEIKLKLALYTKTLTFNPNLTSVTLTDDSGFPMQGHEFLLPFFRVFLSSVLNDLRGDVVVRFAIKLKLALYTKTLTFNPNSCLEVITHLT
jgi:hypothetical protein